MGPSGQERRRTLRRAPHSDEPLSRVRLRTGRELTVVNLSPSGALVEGVTRLLPNTHTDLHIVTRHGRVLVRARVMRALVWRLERDMVCYRTALAFDTTVDTEAAPSLSDSKAPNTGAPSDSVEPILSEPSSHQRHDGSESNGPALSEGSSHLRKDEDGSNEPARSEPSSYHGKDGEESNGPALSEPATYHRKDGDGSNGPALSEPLSGHRPDEGESNGYLLPTECAGKSCASGIGYPDLDLDDRG